MATQESVGSILLASAQAGSALCQEGSPWTQRAPDGKSWKPTTFTAEGPSTLPTTAEARRLHWGEENEWKFPDLGREMNQTRGAQKTPKRVSMKKTALRHMIVRLSKAKDKERILKAGEKWLITCKGTPIKLSEDFSAETFDQERDDMLKARKILPTKNTILGNYIL